MLQEKIKYEFKRRRACSANHLLLHYHNRIKQSRIPPYEKILFGYRNLKLSFTPNQIEVLKLVARGYSNTKIAKKLFRKEATVKLLIYRLMKYMEEVLYESVDRFYLVIIAQELYVESESYEENGK